MDFKKGDKIQFTKNGVIQNGTIDKINRFANELVVKTKDGDQRVFFNQVKT